MLIALFALSFSAFAAKGTHIANAKITMKCSGGKTYTATTDDNGKFTIKDYDCSGDYTFSVKSTGVEVSSWSWGASNSGTFAKGSGGGSGKANVQDLSMTKSSRDIATGQATGKRQHKPVTMKHTLCLDGKDQDCDGTADRCVLEITYDGNTIQGMAINEKGLPGTKPKSNK
jgi:hypothetical protein